MKRRRKGREEGGERRESGRKHGIVGWLDEQRGGGGRGEESGSRHDREIIATPTPGDNR